MIGAVLEFIIFTTMVNRIINSSINERVTQQVDDFGGLVVSMLTSGTRVRGFKPGRSRWIIRASQKSSALPSFGGDVKESVPCPSFATCKRTKYLRELRMCYQNSLYSSLLR